MPGRIEAAMAAIGYIEGHLQEKLDLETVAGATHYSSYHLHRAFGEAAGMTLHEYVRRRRLTEAARLLTATERPILEVALRAGYESQQAFTDAFRAMYKSSPGRFRREEAFYPLQLRLDLNEAPGNFDGDGWRERIAPATEADVPAWMRLVRLAIGGFPHLDEERYLPQLRQCVAEGRALILKDAEVAAGAMALRPETGAIDFLAAHPQYPRRRIAGALCERARALSRAGQISVTTFRAGDRADTGDRATFEGLGFAGTELLVEFGYPTQRMVWRGEDAGE